MTNEDLDKLVQEDIALGKRISPLERVRHAKVRLLMQQMHQAEADYARETAAWRARREEIRAAIQEAWERQHAGEVTLDLPSAKVSRRNYAEFRILDRDALYDALDRSNRLDLAGYTFDEKEVLELLRKGKLLGLREGAVQILDHFNLQVQLKGKHPEPEGPPSTFA